MRLSSTWFSKSKMAAGGAEEHFAKKLANNEKLIRDRAVNKLRAWIRSRAKDGPGFSEVDLLKIWKGLFYCMWMSDKPLIQEELALNISQLVLSFKNENSATLFIKSFFKTMQREWHGIDRLRLDKFYLLIRFFVKETFNFLKKACWEDRLVTEVSSIFHDEPLNPTSLAVPDGIRLHLVSVHVAELESVIDDQVSSSMLLKLLDPLLVLAAHSKNTTVTAAVKKSLLEYLVQCPTDEQDEKHMNFISKVDFAAVADRLFTLASDRNVLGRNRNQLFEWAKRLRKQSTGEHKEGQPVQEGKTTNGIPVGTKRKASVESSEIINGSNEDHTSEEKQKRKKKKHEEKTENEEGKQGEEYIEEKKEGKRKIKHVEENINVAGSLDESVMLEEGKVQSKKMKKKKKRHDEEIENEGKQEEECIEEKKEAKRKTKNTEENLNVATGLDDGVLPEDDKVESKKKKNKKKKSQSENSNRTTDTKNAKSGNENGCEEMEITNGHNTSEHNESNVPLINDSTENSSSALNGNTRLSPNKNDQTLSSNVEKKILHKAASLNSEPFAKFQKNATPPVFVRKCLAKTPNTEPRKTKAITKDQPPGSAPAKGTPKRVRIEMSKNTAHTTQDYQRSLKDSPKIPFDAEKTPTQGLLKSRPRLKSPPHPRRTPLVVSKSAPSTDPGQRQQVKKRAKAGQRAKAVDFF